MFGRTRSSAATKVEQSGPPRDGRPHATVTQAEIRSAWRVAYLVVGDGDLATRAVTKSYLGPIDAGRNVSSGINLLADALRIALTRATSGPPTPTDSAVITALWQLPPEQRAALWLAEVEQLDNHTLGSVLGLRWTNAGPVAGHAAEWLDVALDSDSGPLCPREPELAAFLVGDLPAAEAATFQEHLPTCPTCRTKSRAMDELVDLRGVLDRAVPEPPDTLTVHVLEAQAADETPSGPPTLHEHGTRTPAVRPLAACIAALFLLGLVGLGVVGKKSGPGPSSTGGGTVHVGGIRSADNTTAGGAVGTSSVDPAAGITVPTVTTSSLPPLTFPTVPPRGGAKKSGKK